MFGKIDGYFLEFYKKQLESFALSLSETEEQRCENAIRMI